MKKLFIQKIVKMLIVVIIFIVIAVLGYLAGGIVKYKIDVRKVDKSVEHFQDSLEEPYKKDIYGGKTPEETWAMYIDALKKGDIEMASKYFAVNDQNKIKQALLEGKREDNLKLYLEQLSTPLQKNESLPDFILADKERTHYYYMVKELETGKMIKNTAEFYLNPHTKVWKILF